jgi:hypothetical protein
VAPLFQWSPEIRRITYTTNAIDQRYAEVLSWLSDAEHTHNHHPTSRPINRWSEEIRQVPALF